LKILVVTPLYGGSWPIAGYAARALTELGHETHLLDLAPFHDAFQGLERFGARRANRRVLESGFCDVMAAGIAATVDAVEPDLVLALAQAPLNASALDAIGKRGVLRALWFVEDYRVMTYWRELARHYDHVFTIQADGDLCGCGNRGCLETLVSGPALTAEGVAYFERSQALLVLRPQVEQGERVLHTVEPGQRSLGADAKRLFEPPALDVARSDGAHLPPTY